MNAAIYARVSKTDDSQDLNNQLIPLRNFAKAINVDIVEEYVDKGSGANADRQNFIRMLNAADQKQFGLVLITALDRFSREGISNTTAYLERLRRNGIAIKSLQEGWLDTRDKGIGDLLFAIFAWTAEQERRRLSERVKLGLDRVRREKNIKLGRPKGSKDRRQRSIGGYCLRYLNKDREARKLGPRKKVKIIS
jgi:DNA invertase Pin-like site-specific DNA recombinase